MRIELADEQWVEVRETIKGGDIFAVREANEVPLGDDGRPAKLSFQKLEDDQLIALAARVITAWSFQVPIPAALADARQAVTAARSVLSDLTGQDLRKFRAGMKPLLDLVKDDSDQPDPKQPSTSSSSSS